MVHRYTKMLNRLNLVIVTSLGLLLGCQTSKLPCPGTYIQTSSDTLPEKKLTYRQLVSISDTGRVIFHATVEETYKGNYIPVPYQVLNLDSMKFKTDIDGKCRGLIEPGMRRLLIRTPIFHIDTLVEFNSGGIINLEIKFDNLDREQVIFSIVRENYRIKDLFYSDNKN